MDGIPKSLAKKYEALNQQLGQLLNNDICIAIKRFPRIFLYWSYITPVKRNKQRGMIVTIIICLGYYFSLLVHSDTCTRTST